ncbi:MAG: 4'-phosphopantetheinyl transferase superfamily protein [Kiritimatiellae bacterium]|jgi:phosphopantetheine--protein transferase-like protein|nr:4'-phosphopantetheinyl transferase superfamily protein [Kiritimatiellia bacterium]
MHINIRKFNYKSACEYERFITDEESSKSNRFKYPQGKERYILSKAWTREYISEILDIEPKTIKFQKTANGKPYLSEYPDVFFNISHSEDYFAIVVNEKQDVGIDIEKIRYSENIEKLAGKAFGPKEIAKIRSITDKEEQTQLFYHFWTRREAVIKCLSKKMAKNFKVDISDVATSLKDPMICLSPFDCVEVFDRMELVPEYSIAVAKKIKDCSINL